MNATPTASAYGTYATPLRNLKVLAGFSVLLVGSAIAWFGAIDIEPARIGAALWLVALALVVAWFGFLCRILRGMLRFELSPGYCAVLFFGGWAAFFLIYNCLL